MQERVRRRRIKPEGVRTVRAVEGAISKASASGGGNGNKVVRAVGDGNGRGGEYGRAMNIARRLRLLFGRSGQRADALRKAGLSCYTPATGVYTFVRAHKCCSGVYYARWQQERRSERG